MSAGMTQRTCSIAHSGDDYGPCANSTVSCGLDARYVVPTSLQFGVDYDPNATLDDVVYTMPVLQKLNKEQIRSILVDVLRREEEMRLSPPCQKEFGQIGETHEKFNIFTTRLQSQCSLEFHVDPTVGVELIRSAVSLFPDDEEIKSIPHYVRHNRCRAGHLKPGDPLAPANVSDMSGEQAMQLTDLIQMDRPVVLLGASHT